MVDDEILALEQLHYTRSVRESAEQLGALLSDDFIEFGSSGRIYTKEQAIRVAQAHASIEARPEEPRVKVLAPDAALVLYRAGRSLRSSVWRREGDRWRMVFHQGTPLPEP